MLTRAINVVSILIVGSALVVLGRGLFADNGDGTHSAPEPAQVSPQFLKAAGVGPRIGPDDAPVVLVVYFDYRCSFCREFEGSLRTVRLRYPEHLAVVVKSFVPLDTSDDARLALAAECAHEQGVFEAFHAAAIAAVERQQGDTYWTSVADSIGIPDREDFDHCVVTAKYAERIHHDYAAGMALGVRGVPTSIINGYVYAGSLELSTLDSAVARALPGRLALPGLPK